MNYKILPLMGCVVALFIALVPVDVFAAGASVYLSPSGPSITTGNNVTIQVRVNGGTNSMDSVQADLNFDSAKLQYASNSGGVFTTPVKAVVSGSKFSYIGALLGSSVTSDQLMFSVTFKTLTPGTATLSISGVSVAYAGGAFSPVNTSGGSVVISDPVVETPAPTPTPPPTPAPTPTPTPTPTPKPTPVPAPAEPVLEVDKEAPKLSAEPDVVFDRNTITISFNTNEKSTIDGSCTSGGESISIKNSDLKTEHIIKIGADKLLTAGTVYKVEITVADSTGNTAKIFSQDVRTKGIDYVVKITDSLGNVLSNHDVQLFSDPISATTDENGYVTFNDVTPGTHTLVFDIDGLTLRQSVNVGQDEVMAQTSGGEASNTAKDALIVKLPIRFISADLGDANAGDNSLLSSMLSGALCAVIVWVMMLDTVRRKFVGFVKIVIDKSHHIFKKK
jgi:hypothetical protein